MLPVIPVMIPVMTPVTPVVIPVMTPVTPVMDSRYACYDSCYARYGLLL